MGSTDKIAVANLLAAGLTAEGLFGVGRFGRTLRGPVAFEGSPTCPDMTAQVQLENGCVLDASVTAWLENGRLANVERGAGILVPATDVDGSRVVSINVILTFDDQPQEFYDVSIALPNAVAGDGLASAETDAVAQILAGASSDLDDLVKISLCFGMEADESQTVADYMCRHNAKYYFQPNQRDPYEQAIVDRLGIASRTRAFDVAA